MIVDRFLRVAAPILIGLLLLAAAGLVLLRLQGMQVLTVMTESMQPTLQPSDIVIMSAKSPSALKPGMLVSFASSLRGGQLVTHRIVSVDKQRDIIVTQGDNLDAPDWPMRSRQIVGVVRWQIPGAGRWLTWLRQPPGLIFGIYVPGLTIMGSEIYRLYRLKHRSVYSIYNSF